MKIVSIILLVIGICMILGASNVAINTNNFLDEATIELGEVIDLVEVRSDGSSTYAPVVNFLDSGGNSYEFIPSASSNPPGYFIGEKLEVLYLPLNPLEAKINSFYSVWGSTVILGMIGLILLVISLPLMLSGRLSRKKNENLKKHGEKLTVKIKGVALNTRLSVNGANPYQIVAERIDPISNKVYIYNSKNLWFDPTDYMKEEFITVYVDKLKPKRYFLDTSFLPEIVE